MREIALSRLKVDEKYHVKSRIGGLFSELMYFRGDKGNGTGAFQPVNSRGVVVYHTDNIKIYSAPIPCMVTCPEQVVDAWQSEFGCLKYLPKNTEYQILEVRKVRVGKFWNSWVKYKDASGKDPIIYEREIDDIELCDKWRVYL